MKLALMQLLQLYVFTLNLVKKQIFSECYESNPLIVSLPFRNSKDQIK